MPPQQFAFHAPHYDGRGERNTPGHEYWEQGTAYSTPALNRTGHSYPHQYNMVHSAPFPRPAEHYGYSSHASTPSIDFSGLIPMYGESETTQDRNSRGQSMDLSSGPEWPANMAPYAKDSYTWYPSESSSSNFAAPHWSGGGDQYYNGDCAPSPYGPPSPSSTRHTSSPSSSASSTLLPPVPVRRSGGPDAQKKSCSHCNVTSTPLWRRDPTTHRTLCNACGLYLQQRNTMRPQALIDADIDDDEPPEIPDEEYTGPKCSHCLTRKTSVWRRSKTGAQVCNACGVYARLRGQDRPLSLRRNKIKPRSKHPPHPHPHSSYSYSPASSTSSVTTKLEPY